MILPALANMLVNYATPSFFDLTKVESSVCCFSHCSSLKQKQQIRKCSTASSLLYQRLAPTSSGRLDVVFGIWVVIDNKYYPDWHLKSLIFLGGVQSLALISNIDKRIKAF